MARIILLLVALALPLGAQTRSVTLNWAYPDVAGISFNAWRAPGACAAADGFVKRNAAPLAAKTYTDSADYGTWCYYVTAVAGELESEPSNKAEAAVTPPAPGSLTIVIESATLELKGRIVARVE